MNSRPQAWLRQAEKDLAMAQLAKDHFYLAQACFWNVESNHRTPIL